LQAFLLGKVIRKAIKKVRLHDLMKYFFLSVGDSAQVEIAFENSK
jgi:hypothetical protein